MGSHTAKRTRASARREVSGFTTEITDAVAIFWGGTVYWLRVTRLAWKSVCDEWRL